MSGHTVHLVKVTAPFIRNCIHNYHKNYHTGIDTLGIIVFCSPGQWTLVKVSTDHTVHTHPFNGPLSGTTRVSWYQKGKTNLDFTEATDSERQWHQLGHMQVCTSLQTNNHARLVLPFWYQLTWVVPEKGQLNGCVCVCYFTYLCLLSYGSPRSNCGGSLHTTCFFQSNSQ